MLLRDPSLAPYAREFAIYFDKNTTLAPDVKRTGEWTSLGAFHLSYYLLTDGIEVKLCGDLLVVRLYEFKAITPAANGHVWAVEHGGRLVCFDAKDPESQTLVTNDGGRWLSIGYASQKGRIYATAEDASYISVFDAATGQAIEQETYELPPGPTRASVYQMRVTTAGAILLHDNGSGMGFVMFPEESQIKTCVWHPLKTGDYQAILQGVNQDEIISVNLKGYYLYADTIRKGTKNKADQEDVVMEAVCARIDLPSEPQASLLAVAVDENMATEEVACSDSMITIACQTDELSYLIRAGVKVVDGSVVTFPLKDVSSFYTGWKMVEGGGRWKMVENEGKWWKMVAQEMVEADGKLFILFG